jgi:hypothetical protein
MGFFVDCTCGQRLPVTVAQAGGEVYCPCGMRVLVPRLSELRAGAGLGAYESGPLDTIRAMLRRGELPWGDVCQLSGRPTADVLPAYVQCERAYLKGGGVRDKMIVAYLISPLFALFMKDESQGRIEGRDTYVATPLRVAKRFHDDLARRPRQRRLRTLLRSVPAYARLLDYYPRAHIFIGQCPVDEGIRPERLSEHS